MDVDLHNHQQSFPLLLCNFNSSVNQFSLKGTSVGIPAVKRFTSRAPELDGSWQKKETCVSPIIRKGGLVSFLMMCRNLIFGCHHSEWTHVSEVPQRCFITALRWQDVHLQSNILQCCSEITNISISITTAWELAYAPLCKLMLHALYWTTYKSLICKTQGGVCAAELARSRRHLEFDLHTNSRLEFTNVLWSNT